MTETSLSRSCVPYLIVAVVGMILFALRLAGPSDLIDNDQQRPAAYIMDVIQNGHWIHQRDETGAVASKPPLYTWLAALTSFICGRATLFSLYLPTAMATVTTALLVMAVGRGRFGNRVGILAAMMFLFSYMGMKHLALARTDGLFGCLIAIASLAAYSAWSQQRHWNWFWVACAAATLTKGPLGVLLAGGGLAAAFWEKNAPDRHPLRGAHLMGVTLYLVVVVAWFGLAWWDMGQPFVDKVIGRELVGHAIRGDKGEAIGSGLLKPPLLFLARFAPWSLLACVGFWRVLFRPSMSEDERRFERFLFCWFFVGLVILILAPHKRADLLVPLLPAAVLLAGREGARWCAGWSTKRFAGLVASVGLCTTLIGGVYYIAVAPRKMVVKRTGEIEQLAARLQQDGVHPMLLTHVDEPFALQFHLNTIIPVTSHANAARLLSRDETAYVVVANYRKLWAELDPITRTRVTELAGTAVLDQWAVRVVSNRPQWLHTGPTAMAIGPFVAVMREARLVRIRGETRFEFVGSSPRASVSLSQYGSESRTVEIILHDGNRRHDANGTLSPGGASSLTVTLEEQGRL